MRLSAAQIAMAACALALAAEPARAQVGGPGELFQVGVGGRALGMGGAQVAEAGDATALYYNPAGLALLSSSQVELMHAALFDGASLDHLVYAHSMKAKPESWGVQILRLNSGSIPGADAFNNTTGSFQYSELALSGGFGERGGFLPLLSMGGQAKILKRTFPGSADQFMSGDFGAQYGPVIGEHVMFGIVARNLFSLVSGDTSDKLALDVRTGLSYHPIKSIDLAMEVDQSMGFYVGAEYAFKMLALRAGYNPTGYSFGGGLSFRRSFSFDLAMINSSALGTTQRISLTYRFEPPNRPRRLVALADTYLQNGLGELAAHDYLAASRDIDIALGLDSNVGGGLWKRPGERLRELIKGMDLENNFQDQQELRQAGLAGDLAFRGVTGVIRDDASKGMLLLHVAAGTAGPDSAQAHLLKAASKVTGQNIVRDDILSVGAFVAERAHQSIDHFRAGRFESAVKAANDALLVAPDDGDSWARLGSAQYASGHKDAALAAYRKALDLQPNNDRLRAFVREKFGE